MNAEPAHFEVPWSPLTALWVFLLQLAAVILMGGVLGQVVAGGVLSESLARVLLLPATSLATAVFTLLVVSARHSGQTWRLRGPVRPRWIDVGRGIGYGILAYLAVPVALGWLLATVVSLSGGEMPIIQPTFREFAANPVAAPVFLVSVVLFAPVGEELLFRGMLFQALRDRIGAWPGILLSAAAFAVVHVSASATTSANVIVAVTVFTLGAIFAWIFHRSGSLLVVIVAHCLFNATSAVLLITSGATA